MFSKKTARLCITAEGNRFDKRFIRNWEIEGFDTTYLAFEPDKDRYRRELEKITQGLSVSESYAVIGFGEAAAFCLEHYLHLPNTRKLCALIAYYPPRIPPAAVQYPPTVQVLIHLANQQVAIPTRQQNGAARAPQATWAKIDAGIGTGDTLQLGHKAYAYPSAVPGFAEHDQAEHDPISAGLAWSRSLATLQRAFGKEADLETVWDEVQEDRYFSQTVSKSKTAFVRKGTPSVTYSPTLQGATGTADLQRFYETIFLQGQPRSMRLRLLSRTVGADRVVDELYMSFQHSQEMPWILPGIPPTGRPVDLVLVSIVSLRGGRLLSEHVYWDQASVLMQVGLLDPKKVPHGFPGVERLPVVGRAAASTLLGQE
ncbi:hypothetical protein ASPZODRAFT_162310 [Penicilliopsis zonata CBS 506.65]|uniref:SnoaL-like domain-containing protein n=1 Tax=Penicilliopsis zonata CBS 506.65 TaxID=1073090 RepID=A0A1L9S4Z6_9EURO|nr:hypothetical protein ASPZODRAFT_162310 [Penicilliopsis zonata CBS 506.65]OJJ42228.1 hypothetical protein ASPZODRAFT_162310 [Penicilliopsis zonata CBS 506.65]